MPKGINRELVFHVCLTNDIQDRMPSFGDYVGMMVANDPPVLDHGLQISYDPGSFDYKRFEYLLGRLQFTYSTAIMTKERMWKMKSAFRRVKYALRAQCMMHQRGEPRKSVRGNLDM